MRTDPLKVGRGLGTGVRTAADNPQRSRRRRDVNRVQRFAGALAKCADTACAPINDTERGRGNYAEHGFVLRYQRDVDREFPVSLDEFARPVDGVDDPEVLPA